MNTDYLYCYEVDIQVFMGYIFHSDCFYTTLHHFLSNTSGPTPQVASSAAHMYVCSSKLRGVV